MSFKIAAQPSLCENILAGLPNLLGSVNSCCKKTDIQL